MRAFLRFSAIAAVLCAPVVIMAQQQSTQSNQSAANQSKSSPSDAAASVTASSAPQDSLADAARKAREQKKLAAKPGKVFTNDNIPTSGGISSASASSAPSAKEGASDATPASSSASANDEKSWRDKFAQLRQKLDRDKENLDVMQRELGELSVQYYSDPTKAMQQQLSRDDINKKTAAIDAKKKEVEADQQAIDDAEDDLRKAGGDPGWAR
jgi:hypothetical protein